MTTTLPGSEALQNFCSQEAATRAFSTELRGILEVIAVTGTVWHEWSQLKQLISFRLNQILVEYHTLRLAHGEGPPQPLCTGESFPEMQRRLQEDLERFTDGPPFTSQRLCELLLYPQETYRNVDKAALAIEKLLLVTSTLHLSPAPYPPLPLPAERLSALALPAMPSLHQPQAVENGGAEAMEVDNHRDQHKHKLLGLSLFAGSLPGNRHPDAPVAAQPRSPSPPLAPHSPPRGNHPCRESTPPPSPPFTAPDVGPQSSEVEAALGEGGEAGGREGDAQNAPRTPGSDMQEKES